MANGRSPSQFADLTSYNSLAYHNEQAVCIRRYQMFSRVLQLSVLSLRPMPDFSVPNGLVCGGIPLCVRPVRFDVLPIQPGTETDSRQTPCDRTRVSETHRHTRMARTRILHHVPYNSITYLCIVPLGVSFFLFFLSLRTVLRVGNQTPAGLPK